MSDKETLFKKLGFVINEGGLVDFCDGKGGRSSPHPAEAKKLWELLAVERRAPAPQPAELERDLYALLRGICEDVIDWMATLSYDNIGGKEVLDHPLTKEIRVKLQRMYDHPLDNKLLIRTDQLERILDEAATPQVTPCDHFWRTVPVSPRWSWFTECEKCKVGAPLELQAENYGEGTSEQASTSTGISLDGGKTIHSKFEND